MFDEPNRKKVERELRQRLQQGLPGHLGVELVALGPGLLTVRMTLGEEHIAANGYLHAGSVVTLADTACGFGCLTNLPEGGVNFATIELKANFLHTSTTGVIWAAARLQHGGRRTQVWDAIVRDEREREIALFRCTQMILYRPED